MKHFAKTRTATVSVATAAALILAGGVAYAFWSSAGSGTGSAASGSAQPVTLAAGTVTNNLYPGVTADVATLVTNPNPYAVLISGLTAGTITSGVTACDNGNGVTFNIPSSYPSGTYRVPAKAGVAGSGVPAVNLVITGGVTMAITSDNACQNKTFTIPLTGTATATS